MVSDLIFFFVKFVFKTKMGMYVPNILFFLSLRWCKTQLVLMYL